MCIKFYRNRSAEKEAIMALVKKTFKKKISPNKRENKLKDTVTGSFS